MEQVYQILTLPFFGIILALVILVGEFMSKSCKGSRIHV